MKKAVTFGGLEFETFAEQDIAVLTPVMKRAFDYDTKIHIGENEGGPPGYDNGDFFRQWYLHKNSTAFKISKDGKQIGGLCVWINKNNVNFLGNVFVDTGLQNKGLGKIIWDFVELTYPNTIKWQTDTPAFSRRNHHYYVNKCGFKIVRIDNPKSNDGTRSYFMEKEMV